MLVNAAKYPFREAGARPGFRRLAGFGGRPGGHRRLPDRRPAAVLSRCGAARDRDNASLLHVVPAILGYWLPKARCVVHHFQMIPTQRLPAKLTSLDAALAALLHGLEPGRARGVTVRGSPGLRRRGHAGACMRIPCATPPAAMVGRCAPAISSAPRPIRRCRLAAPPVWVEAGEALPAGCDCVIDADLLDRTGPLVQALAEAIPGQGVRRAGSEIAEASTVIASGRRVRPLDLLIARAAGPRQAERAPSAPALRRHSRELRARR